MKHQQDLSLSFTEGNSLVAQADNVYSAAQTAFEQIEDVKNITLTDKIMNFKCFV